MIGPFQFPGNYLGQDSPDFDVRKLALIRKIVHKIKACLGVSTVISNNLKASHFYLLNRSFKEFGHIVSVPLSDFGICLSYCDLCWLRVFRIKSHSYLQLLWNGLTIV